jgi:hypothetical protein
VALAPAFGPIGGIRTGPVAPVHRADATTVHDRPRPINLIVSSEPIQQREVNEIPHARSLPIAQAAPTRHPRPAPEFLREHLPRDAAAEDEQNAGETRAIGDARPSAFRPTWWSWQERFDKIPQRIWKQRGGHACSRYLADEAQVSEVLLHALRNKLLRLSEYCVGALDDVPELDLGDITARGSVTPVYYQLVPHNIGHRLSVVYQVNSSVSEKNVPISDATERPIENMWPMCEQLAWDHLRERLGAPTTHTSKKRKVYLSYRKESDVRRAFVEGIANRLGREGFLRWFDEWEIMAGDSLPREIAGGLQDAYAIVIVLTGDYPGERWAREELENAISQRVERNIKIIPILLEPCDRPALLQPLRYVDCTVHNPDHFERQFLEIIDALNEVDLNPYRR